MRIVAVRVHTAGRGVTPAPATNRIEAEATCSVLVGSLGSRRVKASVIGTGYMRCAIPTGLTLGDHVVCRQHQGYGGLLPFTQQAMRNRLP